MPVLSRWRWRTAWPSSRGPPRPGTHSTCPYCESSRCIRACVHAQDVGAIILTGAGIAPSCGSRHQGDGGLGRARDALLLGDGRASAMRSDRATSRSSRRSTATPSRGLRTRHGLRHPDCLGDREAWTTGVTIGIIPGFGGASVSRVSWAGVGAEMIYTGGMIDAATAERIGLVNRVVPANRLLEERRPSPRDSPSEPFCDRPRESVSPSRDGDAAIGRLDFETAASRLGRRTTSRGMRHSSRNAGPHGPAPDQYDSNSSWRSMTTCSRTSSNEELRYSRMRRARSGCGDEVVRVFRNSTFTRILPCVRLQGR